MRRTKAILVRLTEEERKSLAILAKREDRECADLIRQLLRERALAPFKVNAT